MELSIVPTYVIIEGNRQSIICMICNRRSHNLNDVRMKYCANCDLMHEEQRGRTMDDLRVAAEANVALDIIILEQIMAPPDNINWGRDGF